jgi:hypothetical protein
MHQGPGIDVQLPLTRLQSLRLNLGRLQLVDVSLYLLDLLSHCLEG